MVMVHKFGRMVQNMKDSGAKAKLTAKESFFI